MTDSTDRAIRRAASTETAPATSSSDDERPLSRAGKSGTGLFAGAALLSTTAMLSNFESELPPYHGD